jgi:hypothetical protein
MVRDAPMARRSHPLRFEKNGDRLASWPRFARRMAISLAITLAIVAVALTAGVLGYHGIAKLGWVDSILNASMILTGMGPVDPMKDTPSKLFASAYALFSGVVFLSAVGIVLSPIFHRIIHAFHIDDDAP